MEKNKIKLNICGTNYTITTDDTEEYMLAIGEQVDRKIKSTMDKNPTISTLMGAELVALEYCDLLNKASVNIEDLSQREAELLKEIKELKENLELKNLEFDELTAKLKEYEELFNTEAVNEVPVDAEAPQEIITQVTTDDEIAENESEIFTTYSTIRA